MTSRFHVYGWTDSEDGKLATIMTKGMEEREAVTKSLQKAGCELGRSVHSCKNRWYIIRENYINVN
jgi:hypothetical protein